MFEAGKFGLVVLVTALGAACNRTPEPPAAERAAVAPPPESPPAAPVPVPAPASSPSSAPSAPELNASAAAPIASLLEKGKPPPRAKVKRVIVIALENHDADEIYSDPVNAPYLHSLVTQYAHAANFEDELPLEVPSEGHYLWMEAGTHHFSDATFLDDSPPSPANSTGSTKHLVTQIKQAKGLSWVTYQEGLNEQTGACPIEAAGFYTPKHDPFIFFRDISGDPPTKDAAYCAEHHKPYSALEHDLQGELPSYVFITPDQCHDMHWYRGCPEENPVRTGDRWLKAELPRLIEYADKHDTVIFISFDEGGSTNKLPFLAVGSVIKPGYTGMEHYTHSSQLKSIELILGLSPLPSVANSNDLSDLFKPGTFP
jgi:hypothetical protein